MKNLFICCFLSFLLSCAFFKAEIYKRPLLNKSARESYIVNYGWDASTEIKLAFIEGQILPGMSTDFLLQIYGQPDLDLPCPKNQSICNRIWQYGANDNKEIVGSVLIKGDMIIKVNGQLSKPCKY